MIVTREERPAAAPVVHAVDRPGFIEHALVVALVFLMVYKGPDAWFADPDSDGGVLLTTTAILGLSGISFLRIAGSIDLIITLFRKELALLLFWLLSFSSIFWTADLAISIRQSLLVGATVVTALHLTLRFEVRSILKVVAFSAFFGMVINYVFVFGLPEYGLDTNEAGTWSGLHGQKNSLGYSAALVIPIAIVLAGADRRHRFAYYLLTLGNLGLLLGSQSKTMLVATVIPVGTMFVYHTFRARKTLRGAAILSFATAGLVAILFATANLPYITELMGKDITLTGRTDLWVDLIPVIAERPILGWGIQAPFGGDFSPIHEVWIQNRWDPTHAHNAILQVWLELGLVGVVLFLITFFRAASRSVGTVRAVDGRLGLWPITFLTATLMISISESGIVNALPSYLLYIVAVWAVALNRPSEETAATPPRAAGPELPARTGAGA